MSDEFGTYKTSEIQALRTQVESLTRERDQARAACAVRSPSARIIDLASRLIMSGTKAAHVSCSETHEISDFIFELTEHNPGQPLLDQLHAYQSGVVEAVADLDLWCSTGYTGHCLDAMETLRPLVTMSAASREARESESCGNVEIVVPTPLVTPKEEGKSL